MHPLCVTVFVCLIAVIFGATSSVEWCYHLPECDDSTWAAIPNTFCNGTRQSPIDLSSSVDEDPGLVPFNLTGFDNRTVMTKIMNTGKSVKVMFKPKTMGLSGGSLSADYLPLQFHLHWGNLSSVPGSEHAVDGHRYPMEMHILSVKSIYSSDFSEATTDSEGLAVLGFFIEVDDETVDQPESWRKLTSYLYQITEKGQSVSNISGISLDDLIGGVDTTSYYRYLGSVTVPACHEIVVWTVFKEPIKVSKNLIDLFSTTVRVGNNSSEFITNNYRTLQPLNGR